MPHLAAHIVLHSRAKLNFFFVRTFNAFGRWAPEAPIDQTLRFRRRAGLDGRS